MALLYKVISHGATWTWSAHVVVSDCKSSSDPAGSLNLRGPVQLLAHYHFLRRSGGLHTQTHRYTDKQERLAPRQSSGPTLVYWPTEKQVLPVLVFNRTKLHLTAWTPMTLNSSSYPLLSSNFKHVSIAHPWKVTQCLEIPFLDWGQAQLPVTWLRKYQNSQQRGQPRLSKYQ